MPPEAKEVLSLPELNHIQTHYGNRRILIEGELRGRPACPRCGSSHVRIKASFPRILRHLRMTNQLVGELKGKRTPRVLGIDEHFFTRKRGYATTFADLRKHTVFDGVLGRSEQSLENYLRKMPEKHRVKIVVMDLSSTYRSIVKKHFPNAKIVADRFHVVRLIGQQFLKPSLTPWGARIGDCCL